MDYEEFKQGILRLSGIELNFYKERQMKRRINSLMRKNSYEKYEDYYYKLRNDRKLYSEFINYLTINVSEFYRNPEQWDVLEKDILPGLLVRREKLKIWSSACSTGDEPYTMVMVLNRLLPLNRIRIIATDIDMAAMEKAKRGLYNLKSIEKLPRVFIQNYFKKNGDEYRISEDVKRCVDFKRLNLLKDEYPSNCDMIVCRNVLIYFTQEAKDMIYSRFQKSLKEGGILFVGSTEQIIMPHKYRLKPIKTFFYIKEPVY